MSCCSLSSSFLSSVSKVMAVRFWEFVKKDFMSSGGVKLTRPTAFEMW